MVGDHLLHSSLRIFRSFAVLNPQKKPSFACLSTIGLSSAEKKPRGYC
jgi:hypothetical protein